VLHVTGATHTAHSNAWGRLYILASSSGVITWGHHLGSSSGVIMGKVHGDPRLLAITSERLRQKRQERWRWIALDALHIAKVSDRIVAACMARKLYICLSRQAPGGFMNVFPAKANALLVRNTMASCAVKGAIQRRKACSFSCGGCRVVTEKVYRLI
jgi:hypothetical protein